MGIDFSIPLAGLTQAETSLNTTATRIASMGTTRIATAGQADTVDLSAEMVALMEARSNFALNAKVAQTQNQVAQSLINLLG
jgi:flagellar hook protein FlgE